MPPSEPAPASDLTITVELVDEPEGQRFGIEVPALRVKLGNRGDRPIAVPKPGLSTLLSLELQLSREGASEVRAAGVGKPVTIELEDLAPGGVRAAMLSALDHGPGERALEVGVYDARVCVRREGMSPFAERHGGECSEPVKLEVTPVP